MYVNAYNLDVLNYIYNNGYKNQRNLAGGIGYSLGKTNESLKELVNKEYLTKDYQLTDKATHLIQENKPKHAVILAAGYGMRMVPINYEQPKGLLNVKEEPIIERLIKQLHEVGVYDIDIIVGFLKEKFDYLTDKYNVKLTYNPSYAQKNNLHSLNLLADKIGNSYILPSDIWLEDNPFSESELYSWYLLNDQIVKESAVKLNRQKEIVETRDKDGQGMIGIAYLTKNDAAKLQLNLDEMVQKEDNDQLFWEDAFFNGSIPIQVYGKECSAEKAFEIDTYEQLRELDEKSDSLNASILTLIAQELDVEVADIRQIEVMKKGMTNRSFIFTVDEDRYIMRIPGEGTDELINRENEYQVYQTINDLKISDDLVYMSKTDGYKITKYIENSRNCDAFNWNEVKSCLDVLKEFHSKKLKVNHEFDLLEKIEFYESLWEGQPSMFKDYKETKSKVIDLLSLVEELPKEWALTHVDPNHDNFLMTDNKISLIDWEYASMQDQHLDIAMFANYAMYDRNQVDQLIDIYFDGKCNQITRIKIYAYIAISGLLWSNWCEYKHHHGVEFGEYSLVQYRYAKDYYKIVQEELAKLETTESKGI